MSYFDDDKEKTNLTYNKKNRMMYGDDNDNHNKSEEYLLDSENDIGDENRVDQNEQNQSLGRNFLSDVVGFSSRKRLTSTIEEIITLASTTTNHSGEYQRIDDDVSLDEENEREEQGELHFWNFFISSKGPPQIILLSTMFAFAVGSTVGVVPAVLTQKYAELHHGFNGICLDYGKKDKPHACLDGSSDAQAAASVASFVSNVTTFLTSSLVGALSDEYGRRIPLVFVTLAILLTYLSIDVTKQPLKVLVLIQIFNSIDPGWYYAASATGGIVSWISIALSSLSDVMPGKWRTPMFGLVLSGFSFGFALSPILAIFCTHFASSLFSLLLLFLSFIYSLFFLPETLSPDQLAEARLQHIEYSLLENESRLQWAIRGICRPFKELSILNRNNIFRLLSVLAFFSGMSTSADQTLLLYYVEDRLQFNDKDIATLFGLVGIIGIFVQAVLLKPITELIGERFVIVIAFICGATTNTLYAFANTKTMIFVAVVVSTFTSMSFPTISALKSNNAEESEQGRIQGALYALSSLANAVGPALLRVAYEKTKNTSLPGSFFLVATVFYLAAVLCSLLLPKAKANSSRSRQVCQYDEVALIET